MNEQLANNTNGKKSIRIGSVSPGLTRSQIVQASLPHRPDFSEQIFSTFPCLEAADVADLIVYLLSTPPPQQLPDLQVQHVHSGLQNNYSANKSLSDASTSAAAE